jgi:hypothetical protein
MMTNSLERNPRHSSVAARALTKRVTQTLSGSASRASTMRVTRLLTVCVLCFHSSPGQVQSSAFLWIFKCHTQCHSVDMPNLLGLRLLLCLSANVWQLL